VCSPSAGESVRRPLVDRGITAADAWYNDQELSENVPITHPAVMDQQSVDQAPEVRHVRARQRQTSAAKVSQVKQRVRYRIGRLQVEVHGAASRAQSRVPIPLVPIRLLAQISPFPEEEFAIEHAIWHDLESRGIAPPFHRSQQTFIHRSSITGGP